MENSLKGIVLAASTIITCIILSVGFYYVRESKAVSVTSANKLNHFHTELTESDLTSYDGLVVTGSDVVNLIKKQLGEYTVDQTAPIYVYVKTSKKETKYTNGSSITLIKDFTNEAYINPIGKFQGAVVRDNNDVIVGISFKQS